MELNFLVWPIALVAGLSLVQWYEKHQKQAFGKVKKFVLVLDVLIAASILLPWATFKESVTGLALIVSGNYLILLVSLSYLIALIFLLFGQTNKLRWISYAFAFSGLVVLLYGALSTFGLVEQEGFKDLTLTPVVVLFIAAINNIGYAFLLEWKPKNKVLRDFVNLESFRNKN